MKRILFFAAALIMTAAFHTSVSAVMYTESFPIIESGSSKADTLNESGILIRNNRNVSDKNQRGANLREAYIKIDLSDYAGSYPVEQARLRLYLKTQPSNNGVTSELETPTCDVYAFASFNTDWDGNTITYTEASGSGVRPAVNELSENPVAYEENPETGYLDMQSFTASSSASSAYYFDITPYVNDMLLRGQTVGTIVLMQAGGSISRESTVMQFYCEKTASDSAVIPAVVITPGVVSITTDRTVRNFSAGSVPYATVAVHNNTEEAADISLLGVVCGSDGRVYDAVYLSQNIPANGRNSASIILSFEKTLPSDINGCSLNVFAFDSMNSLSLLNRVYTYGDESPSVVVTKSEAADKKPSVKTVSVTENNSETGTISIAGALDAARPGTQIIVRAYFDGDEETSVNQAFAVTQADNDGEFKAVLCMPECSGNYRIEAGGLDVAASGVLETVSFYSFADVSDVMKLINAAQSEEEMKAAVLGEGEIRNFEILGVDYAPALEILNSTSGFDGFFASLLAKKTLADGFESGSVFLAVLKETADMYTIAAAASYTAQLGEIVERYVCGTDIYTTLYAGDNPQLADGVKNEIIAAVLGRAYASIEELCEVFDEKAVLIALSDVLYSDAEQVLRIGKSVLGFDIDAEQSYKNLSLTQRAAVLKNLNGENFESADDVYKKLSAWINAQKKQTAVTGGGASGGSVGGGGSSVNIVKITPEEAANAVPEPIDSNNIAEFKDLDGWEWAQPSINALYKKEIIAAGDGYFRPGDDITRAEFVKMLVCAFDMVDETADCSFSDTDRGMWHYAYIASAYKSGIVSGVSETQFGADQRITRQEMAAMAYRVLKLKNVEMSIADCSFDDVDRISDWAITPVYALKSAGIINGVSESEFAPLKNALRAEATVIINGLLSYTGN